MMIPSYLPAYRGGPVWGAAACGWLVVGCRLNAPDAGEFVGETEAGSTSTTGGVLPESTGVQPESTGAVSPSSSGIETSGVTETTTSGTEETTTDSGTTNTTGIDPVCGDGVVEGDEACDDAGESPQCNADCTLAQCGDAVVNAAAGEQCDDAGRSPSCNADCTLAACGDGIVNAAADEACDDAGPSAGCDADCTAVACGDGLANSIAGEQCDGPDLLGASCSTEGFDGGVLACTGACGLDTSNCTVCGDGVRSLGEECEGADLGGATCVGLGYDGGALACTGACTLDVDGCHTCGDGMVEGPEQCDGGGESAVCDADCTVAICGDGTLNPSAGESCDDGGASPFCDVDCTPPSCGDGVPNAAAGEQCDDGNGIDDDACSSACTFNACGFDVTLLPLFVHPDNSYGEIDFDGSCNLIVAGCFTQALYGISPAGAVSVAAPFPGIYSVNGVAYRASDDTIYVATDGPPQLWSVSPLGAVSLVMPLPTTINAIEIAPPAFGPYADRIIGAGTDGSIHAFDPAAGTSVVVGTPGGILSSLVFHPAAPVLYVAANSQGAVLEMDAGGASASIAGGFSGIDGLAISPSGVLLVADPSAGSVSAIDLVSGTQSVIGNPVLDGGYYVTGMLYEANGNVLVKVAGANIGYVTP